MGQMESADEWHAEDLDSVDADSILFCGFDMLEEMLEKWIYRIVGKLMIVMLCCAM